MKLSYGWVVVGALASLGRASGPWVGSHVFDTYRSYAWLYIGSFRIVAVSPTLRQLRFQPPPQQLSLRHA